MTQLDLWQIMDFQKTGTDRPGLARRMLVADILSWIDEHIGEQR